MINQNPFVPPSGGTVETFASSESFHYNYVANLTFLFTSPNWIMNWLCVTLMLFIPFLGPIVLMGYLYEIIGQLIYQRAPQYPDFDFGKFGAYLSRGIWPFLVALAIGLCMVPIILLVALLQGAVIASIGADGNEGLIIASTLAVYFVFFVVGMLINLVLIPFQLRSGLAQDFAAAFNLGFAKDFISKVWVELLLGLLFITVVSPFLALAGFLVLCVGYLFALSLLTLAFGYHIYQIYRLYLQRGGELVPYKPSN